jgi:hypothetical protein
VVHPHQPATHGNLVLRNILDDKLDEFRNTCIVGGESGYEKGEFKYRPSEIPWYEEIYTLFRSEKMVSSASSQSDFQLVFNGKKPANKIT